MDYNDNNACLEVLEGSGLFDVECGPYCTYMHCHMIGRGLDFYMKENKECPTCEHQKNKRFQPPTSDQAFEILKKFIKNNYPFRFNLLCNEDWTDGVLVLHLPELKYMRFAEGPLSQRLIAALAWLVINKLEELKEVLK
jgi:hypothetical protein